MALPCALVGKPGGVIECAPISEETPLSKLSHYVAGVQIPAQAQDPESAVTFESFYAALGISTLPTVCDGDCGFDVMTSMLGLPAAFATRQQLRVELSEYLLERMGQRWMLDLLVAAQELQQKDVDLCVSAACSAANAPRPPPPRSRGPARRSCGSRGGRRGARSGQRRDHGCLELGKWP